MFSHTISLSTSHRTTPEALVKLMKPDMMTAMPIHLNTANVVITLPGRIYKTDCVVVDYSPEQYVKIEL